jgi:hypothetical protein
MASTWRRRFKMDMSDVSSRLERRFGLGTRPDLRKALYQRLERLVENEGEPAYLVIASAAADAVSKDNPGRYFAHVVITRLMERGIVPAPEL